MLLLFALVLVALPAMNCQREQEFDYSSSSEAEKEASMKGEEAEEMLGSGKLNVEFVRKNFE